MISLALRNTTRRRTRTLLTAGMVVVGVAALLIALSWVRGVFGSLLVTATSLSGHVRVVKPEFAAKEELNPLHENLERSGPLRELLARQPGVRAVEERIMVGVTATVGDEIGDVYAALVGASERYFRERMQAKDKLVSGAWFSGAKAETIIGSKLAERLGAHVGQTLVLLGLTQDGSLSAIKARIVGVMRTGTPALDQQAFMSLDEVRYLADIPEGATELLVYGAEYNTGDALAERVRALPELRGLEVQAWSAREPWRSLSGTVRGIEQLIVLVTVLITALGIWNTMMMSVLERTHEIGVLRALGLSRWGAVQLFVGEAVSIACLGGAIGVALGAYPAWLLEKYGVHIGERMAANGNLALSETMHAKLTSDVVWMAFGLGLLMALLGSLIPALRAASIQPVAAMRTGR